MGRRGGLCAVVVVALGATALLVLPTPAPAVPLRVSVNGKPLALVRSDATVTDVLAAAKIEVRVGQMRSIATGDPVPDRIRQARAWIEGRLVALDARVRSGDRIRFLNGRDFVEPVDERVTSVRSHGLPEVEMRLWQQGRDGVVKQLVGHYSGQHAGEVVVTPPVPAVPVANNEVLLTFDDGPDAKWTPQVLDILRAGHVKAVFCVVGVQVLQHPDLLRRIHADGHTLCDHSMHHDMRMHAKGDHYANAEIEGTYNLIRDVAGVTPRFYRGPGGVLSPFIIERAHQLGMRVLAWDVDPADYRKPGAATIQNRVAQSVRGGSVALMHDGGGDRSQTVAQLPGLIARLRAAGYSFVVP